MRNKCIWEEGKLNPGKNRKTGNWGKHFSFSHSFPQLNLVQAYNCPCSKSYIAFIPTSVPFSSTGSPDSLGQVSLNPFILRGVWGAPSSWSDRPFLALWVSSSVQDSEGSSCLLCPKHQMALGSGLGCYFLKCVPENPRGPPDFPTKNIVCQLNRFWKCRKHPIFHL